VIIGFNGSLLTKHKRKLEYYAALGKVAAEKTTVPAALLLNEASSFQQIVQAIRYGFNAVMFDGSFLPFNKNINLTKKIVEVAHSAGVCVEAQCDPLPLAKDGVFFRKIKKANMTDPKKAAEFVNKTGIDALSISIGNIHLLYKGEARLDFTRLKSIREAVDIPLVLHGATGIADDSIKKAILQGISKVNVGTILRMTFTNCIRMALEKSPSIDPEGILKSAEQELKKLIKSKIKVFGCAAKAKS
jgi:tagatose 1,6-diphosphate aldolase GatY/KbaY